MSPSRVTVLAGLVFLLFLAASAGPLHADGGLLQFSPAEEAYLKTKTRLTIVCDPSWPPYEYRTEDGGYEGMSIDYHARLSQLIGIPIVPIPTDSWSESLRLAEEGRCDLVSSLNKTPLRSRYLDFTAPFINAEVVIIGRKGGTASSLADFEGRTLAVVKGYKMEEDLAKDHPAIRQSRVPTTLDSLSAVAAGEAEATIATRIEANHLIRVNGLDGLQILGTTPYDNHQRLGVRKGDRLLLSIMDKAIASLSDADRQAIEKAWIADTGSFSPILSHRNALYLTAGIVALGIAGWIVSRRKGRKPTAKP